MSQKQIRAYFSSYEQAEEVATRLRTLSVKKIHLDQIQKESGGNDLDTTAISTLTLPLLGNSNASGYMPNAGTGLFAADYFFSDGEQEGIRYFADGTHYLLEATIDSGEYDRATGIVYDCGGRL